MVQSNLKWSFEFGIGMAAIIPFWMKLRGFLVVGLQLFGCFSRPRNAHDKSELLSSKHQGGINSIIEKLVDEDRCRSVKKYERVPFVYSHSTEMAFTSDQFPLASYIYQIAVTHSYQGSQYRFLRAAGPIHLVVTVLIMLLSPLLKWKRCAHCTLEPIRHLV